MKTAAVISDFVQQESCNGVGVIKKAAVRIFGESGLSVVAKMFGDKASVENDSRLGDVYSRADRVHGPIDGYEKKRIHYCGECCWCLAGWPARR